MQREASEKWSSCSGAAITHHFHLFNDSEATLLGRELYGRVMPVAYDDNFEFPAIPMRYMPCLIKQAHSFCLSSSVA